MSGEIGAGQFRLTDSVKQGHLCVASVRTTGHQRTEKLFGGDGDLVGRQALRGSAASLFHAWSNGRSRRFVSHTRYHRAGQRISIRGPLLGIRASALFLAPPDGMGMGQKTKTRGPSKRLSPELLAVVAEVSVRDVAALHGISVSLVRTFIAQGMPCYRYPSKLTVPREAGAQWLDRFRSDRVSRIVDDVLKDLR